LRAAIVLGCVLAACAPRAKLGPPPEPPSVAEPQLLMPGDLELVVRLDLQALRGLLGEDMKPALERVLRTAPADVPDASTSRLLLALFARAKTAWVGVRPGLAPELTDNVLVLRGEFTGLVPAKLGGAPAWSSARDLGGGLLRFERPAPKLRVAPAVLYVRAPDLVVVGSYAEIDALERTVELGRGDPPLEPPSTGVCSVAARLGGLTPNLAKRAPTVAKLAQGAETLSASAAFDGAAVDLQAELAFDSSERARLVADALGDIARALASPERAWLADATFTAIERFVTARLRVPAAELPRALELTSPH
jgi:hypothetical protein